MDKELIKAIQDAVEGLHLARETLENDKLFMAQLCGERANTLRSALHRYEKEQKDKKQEPVNADGRNKDGFSLRCFACGHIEGTQ